MPVRVEAGAEPIPGYKFIDRLGGGGFGEVWKVEAPGGLLKAIKVVYGDLHTADPDGTRRAEQELKALKRVQSVRHPYLLSLERYDIIEGRLLIVMELADRNLWDRFRECRMQNIVGIPRDELMRYMEESAEVLDLMNMQHQLQHLDIKPQNIFMVHNHAKVADFGLVKDLEGMMATVTGGITPVYAAPETFDGIVSRFCDQYSLAIVYQELLTGQRPFSGTSLQQLIMQHLNAQPNLAPLPKADRGPIARSLAKKPEARYPTCMDLVRALRAAGSSTEVLMPKVTSAPRPPQAPASTERPESHYSTSFEPSRAETPVMQPSSGSRSEGSRSEGSGSRHLAVEETGPPVQELAPSVPAPPEITGEGVLFPALVIGVGQQGLEVLQTLRESLHERFGNLQALPNLHLLYIDTDPDAVLKATRGTTGSTLPTADTLLARLNRASHYLKPTGGRLPIDGWFNPKLLYRIPRNPVTTGMRALGRLAFVDNYRTISSRIRSELEALTKPDVLGVANKHTRLGLRTNRPRVYVIANLAGGTGGGMFIDMGYVARSMLRQLGYTEPDVIGLFFVPAVDRKPNRTVPLGNAYASLTELNHFSVPDQTFSFRFDEREQKLKDRDPPYRRTIIMPLEPVDDQEREGEGTRLVGDYLYRELTTKLGRSADADRAKLPPPNDATEVGFQTMGLYRYSWPRRTLLQRAGRQLCFGLAQRWTAKDAAPIRDAVRTWLAEELTKQELDPDHLISHLQKACEETLRRTPETVFASLVEPFVPKVRRPPDPDIRAVLEALGRMEELVGGPEKDGVPRKDILLNECMEQAARGLAQTWGGKLTQLIVCLIEQPDYRLAGSEEALRQLSTTIDKVLEHHESLCRELADRANEAHARIHALLDTLRANPGGGRRNAPVITDLVEVLKLFPKWRYQSLVLRHVTTIYVSLRGQLSDQVREVNFCRQRLGELVRAFESPEGGGRSSDPAPGMCLLPSGCRTVNEAIQRLLDGLTPADIRDLDEKIQGMVEQQFTSLVHICLASGNLIEALEGVMQQTAEAYAGARLVGTNVVEMFLNQHPDESNALHDIENGFADTIPELAGAAAAREAEVRILALPPGPLAEQFRTLVQKALPETELTITDSADDIVFYRELPHLALAELKVLGGAGQEAYRQMSSSEAFPPHARTDITDWQEPR
ncbi:MAG: protein kinase [Gemmataceae bacterium]|nr:protein kinase [Gemmataceae bacterium]